MYYIDQIKVVGFWGKYEIDISLSNKVNFFIGENGTGKTTFINLVAAALSGDFHTLDKLDFASVELSLRTFRDKRLKPSILVRKVTDFETGIDSIDYTIYPSATSDPVQFSLEDIEEQRLIRRRPSTSYLLHNRRRRDLTNQLSTLVSLVWLSIHRSTALGEFDDRGSHEKSFDSSVDMKLSELSSRLSRYYSALVTQRDSGVRDLQEFTLMSLLEERNDQEFFSFVKEVDVDEQKAGLIEAFETIGLRRDKFSPKANRYFKTIKDAKGRKDPGYTIQQIQAMVVLQQIDQITSRWRKEKARQDRIFEDFHSFLDIMNELLNSKKIKINSSAQLVTRADGGYDIDIFELSSGEKQLLILLGEALLQEHASCVYIADEPELSLHMKWQEQIIPSIMRLNENAQMMVATHSPDIVGPFQSNVIRMSEVLKETNA